MKKFLLMFVFALAGACLFAQTEIPVPEDAAEVFTKFQFWVGSFAPLVGLTVFLTSALTKLFSKASGGVKQVFSWGMGMVLVVALNLSSIGMGKGLLWYGVIAYGVAVSLGANHVFDAGLLDSILKMFKLYKAPAK